MVRGLVVACVVTMIVYLVARTAPGGDWQNEYAKDKNGNSGKNPYAGQPMLAYTDPKLYETFVNLKTCALLSSLTLFGLMLCDLNRRLWIWLLTIFVLSIVGVVYICFHVYLHPPPIGNP